MDEQKKPAGRPQIYQGWQPEQAGRRRPRPAQRTQEEKRKGEYRPLAVTEQNVSEEQPLNVSKVPRQKVIHVADLQQKRTTERKAVQQPRTTEHKAVQQARTTERKAVQQPRTTEHKVVQQMHTMERKAVQQPTEQEQAVKQKKRAAAKRRRELENDIKIRSLWGIFGVLSVILTVAIVYEVILGHGIKETGAERMKEQKQELVVDTEQNTIEILTPGGELVSEIKEREKRRSMQREAETAIQTEEQTEDQTEDSVQ